MIAEESCIFSFQAIQYFHIVYLNGIGSSTFHLTVTIFIYLSNFFQSIAFWFWYPDITLRIAFQISNTLIFRLQNT